MPLKLDGTYGVSGVVGTASSAAVYGADADSGIVFSGNQTLINSDGSTIATIGTSGINVTGIVTSTTISVGSGTSISSPAINVLTLGTNNSERIRIKSDGNFGINNNNPLSTLSVGTRTSDVSDSSLIFTAGGSSSGGEVLAATFCNTASGATNNSTAISFTCRSGDSQTAKIVAKQPSGASSPNTQLEFYVYGNSGSTKVVTFDQNGRVLMPYQPCFQASGNQSTTYTGQVVPFNVSLSNNGSNYSTSTYRFTAPVAGHYFFTLHAILGPDGNGQAAAHIRRNGTVVATIHRNTNPQTFAWEQGACSAVLYLNVSDYVDCYIASGTIYLGSNITGGDVYSAFNGHLIG